MLALGVGNAWAETAKVDFSTLYSADTDVSSTTFSVVEGISLVFDKGTGSTAPKYYKSGTAVRLYAKGTMTVSSTIGKITKITLAYGSSDKTNTISVNCGSFSTSNWTGEADEVIFTIDGTSGHRRIKSVEVTYTPSAGGGDEPPTPPTTYTIKWHTAKGVTTDVTLNEGATITKPETDPAMTGYEFMGWTASCDVALDGSDFTALTDFGTADSDKAFYAVFAVATTTGGGAATETTASVVIKDYASAKNWANGTQYTTVEVDANITATVTGGSNTGKYYTSGNEWRLYQTESPTLTISAKNDININTVKVTYNQSNNGVLKLNSSNVTSGTVKDVNASSITFSVGNSGSATNGQVKVTAMEVVYTSGGGGTTTYDNYITTCASGIEYIELGDAFKWSATEAEVTINATDNVFPTLTNTHNVPVTYSSSDDAIASIAADGTVTLKQEGSVTITAKYAGGTSTGTDKEYKAKTVTYSLKVNKAAPVASGTTYVKVTSTAGITDGEYLIVYETGKVAFDGSLATLDAVSNTIEVEITDGTIAGTNYIDDATFTIDATAGTIKSASGYYIGKTATGNGLNANKTEEYTNTITIDADKNAVVKSSGGSILRYNNASNQARFRYYGSGQQAIALYKKASKHTVTIADCTNGSVSAKMGETELVTNNEVLSGTQITLGNEADPNYKLTAYDVYKTGDNTTKVTVTDDTFIMPEFDVTISATFELAKTLTSIEITNNATQTTFWQGEAFNHDGLKVTAHFDGAADEDVTDKVTVNGSTVNAGIVAVEVSFTEGSTTKTTNYDITIKATANGKETAYDVATAREIIDKVSTADNVYVTGIVSEIVTAYDPTYGNISYNISADGLTTSDQLQAFRGKSYNGEKFTSADDIQVGDEVVVFGNLLKYSSTYELNAGNQLVDLKRDRQQAGLIFAQTELTAYVGEEFTEPELTNPNGLSVEYSTSDATLATVDETTGDVTIGSKAGTVTITASFAGNETYLAGNASYNITITDPNQLEATFVAGTDKSEELTITKNGITVEFTNGTFNRTDNYRCYGKESMTISYADGNITKIVFTCDGSSYGPDKFSTETVTYSYSGSVGTWVGDAKSVTFTASAQVRMTDITVYYKQDKRANAELAWSEESVSLTVGDAFTAPTFNNPNSVAPISFKSDNINLATVNNAGAISLKAGAVGTAIITATFAGNETYKDVEVSCTITVNPKTEDVVIVAQREGKWYALKAATGSSTKSLAALEVEYVNGVLYNVPEEDKASITWKRSVVGNIETFQYGGEYLKGKSSTDLFMEEGAEGLYQWDKNAHTMLIGSTNRTFLYQGTYFKNYAISNAGKTVDGNTYSSLPVVTAAKFENATIITRSDLSAGNFGTICYENNITNFTGATFYEVAGKEGRKVIFDEVTELVAGMPYIFRAEAAELKIVLGQENTTTAGQHKSLQGTFEKIEDGEAGEAGNTLEGNYIIYNNFIKKCGAKCGLLGNRAYFIADALNNLTAPVSPAPGRKRVSMDVLGENEATGVDNITENGVIAPAMQGTYDVLGRQLSEPTATGFYIVNGKKVFVVK